MFKNIYKGKKVLVTGNTGFKGTWLSQWLLKMDAVLFGISNSIPDTPSLYGMLNLSEKIKHYDLDIRETEKIYETIDRIKPDFIFHLAAQAIVSESYKNPIDTISTNIAGTANILDALKRVNHPCVAVLISSDKCYENMEWTWGYRENDRLGGKDIYSASKGAMELMIHAYYHSFFKKEESNIRIISARSGNVIGGGDWAKDRIVPDCYRAWKDLQHVEIRNPDSTRPWQHVLDPLSGYLRAGQLLHNNEKLNGESYNFGPISSQNYTVKEMLEKLKSSSKLNPEQKKYIFKKDTGTFPESALLKLNCEKALQELNWKPTLNFEETIEFTTQWYDHFYQQKNLMDDFTINQIDQYISTARAKEQCWIG